MKTHFNGKTQTTFTRHSCFDNGTYVSFKDASRDQENPVLATVALAGMAAVGFLFMCALTAWGY